MFQTALIIILIINGLLGITMGSIALGKIIKECESLEPKDDEGDN